MRAHCMHKIKNSVKSRTKVFGGDVEIFLHLNQWEWTGLFHDFKKQVNFDLAWVGVLNELLIVVSAFRGICVALSSIVRAGMWIMQNTQSSDRTFFRMEDHYISLLRLFSSTPSQPMKVFKTGQFRSEVQPGKNCAMSVPLF